MGHVQSLAERQESRPGPWRRAAEAVADAEKEERFNRPSGLACSQAMTPPAKVEQKQWRETCPVSIGRMTSALGNLLPSGALQKEMTLTSINHHAIPVDD